MLQIQSLSVSYDKHSKATVLKNVNLAVNNEKIVIVGPNGSGKSTLFKAILGLAPIREGSVKVFDEDVKRIRQNTGLSTNLAEVYRLAYVRLRDLVQIFAELKNGNPNESYGSNGSPTRACGQIYDSTNGNDAYLCESLSNYATQLWILMQDTDYSCSDNPNSSPTYFNSVEAFDSSSNQVYLSFNTSIGGHCNDQVLTTPGYDASVQFYYDYTT